MSPLYKIMLVLLACSVGTSNAMETGAHFKQEPALKDPLNKEISDHYLQEHGKLYTFLYQAAHAWNDYKNKLKGDNNTAAQDSLKKDEAYALIARFMHSSTYKKIYNRQAHFDTLFTALNEKIKQSDFHVPDWNDPKYLDHKNMRLTHCFHAAEYVIASLTGINDVRQHLNKIAIGRCPCTDCGKKRALKKRPAHDPITPLYKADETFCGFGQFCNKTAHQYDNAVAQQLFSRSTKAKHMLFFVNIHHGSHVFVIEKICDGLQIGARIFHSWQNYFTLNEWLGNDDWNKNKAKAFDAYYTRYGRGTLVGLRDVARFIDAMILSIYAKPGNAHYSLESLPMYVKIFTVA